MIRRKRGKKDGVEVLSKKKGKAKQVKVDRIGELTGLIPGALRRCGGLGSKTVGKFGPKGQGI